MNLINKKNADKDTRAMLELFITIFARIET